MATKKKKPVRRRLKKPEDPTWKTISGEILKIKDMPDDHLRNSHRMLRRSPWIGPHVEAIKNLETEIQRRQMQPLPVFLNSYDEAEHLLKRVTKLRNDLEKLEDIEFR